MEILDWIIEFQASFLTHYYFLFLQGIAAFWKGAVPTAFGMALENAMAFGVNEALKRAFPDAPKEGILDAPPDLGKPFLMVRTRSVVKEKWGHVSNSFISLIKLFHFHIIGSHYGLLFGHGSSAK